uniref:Translation initiation factor IF-2, chloroplastic n=1 Tax=Compsopogon caeruleus TaxID=31354 RepID=A0A7S1XF18_9RHOD|mmetsp:Transcript_5054/g.10240  ORF Transcript_5054/g.10240 Transcript_5054/m.10240 type:complete len:702 (+) Transcript_5054:531-2636(+)|eukprot:CAMPEP_0184687584 /NCGR_PEP_ID=MMETSP0312-20130426/26934_1 /TAXON_ID=31354 /ORGANISM="Compsopogon coeruleus, Strain SAG 36.94" /LENGTH=701 /DNA_ID=CAMNT_0027143895 /DNA_START=476 /DNA_END=2581 /DNA_ORIENTATION=+
MSVGGIGRWCSGIENSVWLSLFGRATSVAGSMRWVTTRASRQWKESDSRGWDREVEREEDEDDRNEPVKRRRGRRKERLDEVERVAGGGGRQRSSHRRWERETSRATRLCRLRGQVLSLVDGESLSVAALARRLSARVEDVAAAAKGIGLDLSTERQISCEEVEILASELGISVEKKPAIDVDVYLTKSSEVKNYPLLPRRPPIVSVMGHVDHGKTTLLDALRGSSVAKSEVGGITQSIGAFPVQLHGERITFLDTPGHEAFSQMRARGVNVTDITILVVAADDGVMPQTIEAANHARAAQCPVIVAINKIDSPGADSGKVRSQLLAEAGIHVEDLGGDIQCVDVSAIHKHGLTELTEAVLLQAELLDLRADPGAAGEAICVESFLDPKRGPVVNCVVQWGTLQVGQHAASGTTHGRIRSMAGHNGQSLKEAGPSAPVSIVGLKDCPAAGSTLIQVDSEIRAKEIVNFRQSQLHVEQPSSLTKDSDVGEEPLNIVVKAKVSGSAEAVSSAIERMSSPTMPLRVIHQGPGGVTKSDVFLAKACEAVILGFDIKIPNEIREQANFQGVPIRAHRLIYKLIEDIPNVYNMKRGPKTQEVIRGVASVQKIFDYDVSKDTTLKIAGCRVEQGTISRKCKVRVVRGVEQAIDHEGLVQTLKRYKDDVDSVTQGQECGICILNYGGIQPGDMIEAYDVVPIDYSETSQ